MSKKSSKREKPSAGRQPRNDSAETYEQFFARFSDGLNANSDRERVAIDSMARAQWNLRLAQFEETRLLTDAINAVDPAITDPDARMTAGYLACMHTDAFQDISKSQERYSKQYERAVNELAAAREESKNEQSNPLNESFMQSWTRKSGQNKRSNPLNNIFIMPKRPN